MLQGFAKKYIQNFAPKRFSYSCNSKAKGNGRIMDGNEATATVAYKMSEQCFGFPISPSAEMANSTEEWSKEHVQNIFGKVPVFSQLESEAGVISACQGTLETGGIPTTFTASQGLLLMIPTMYIIAGSLHPFVLHVASRSLATSSTNIQCDHSDVMAIRSTGFSMLSSATPQECYDKALISHMATWKTSVPICHFFDGAQTSHQLNYVEFIEDEEIKQWMKRNKIDEKIYNFTQKALNPTHPSRKGSSISTIHAQLNQAAVPFFENAPDLIQETMDEFFEISGRKYELFEYTGDAEAENIIISMGCTSGDITSTVAELNKNHGKKYGSVAVNLFRPFSIKHLLSKIPKTCKKIAVLDRTNEFGNMGPLYLDVASAIHESGRDIIVVGGKYGIGGFPTLPKDIKAVYDNLELDNPTTNFILGVDDPRRLPYLSEESIEPLFSSALFFGVGGDGTIGSIKTACNLITKNLDYHASGNSRHTAHKTFGITESDLRFCSKNKCIGGITTSYPITDSSAEYVVCNSKRYTKLPLVKKLKKGGTFIMNLPFDKNDVVGSVEDFLPNKLKKEIAEKEAKFFVVNGGKISEELKLGGYVNVLMLTVFFMKSGIFQKEDDPNYLLELMKEEVGNQFGKKGKEAVQRNENSIEKALSGEEVFEVKYDKDKWIKCIPEAYVELFPNESEKTRDFARKVTEMYEKGIEQEIKVSDLDPSGYSPPGTSKYEKRNFAVTIPRWDADKCVQCNTCSFGCPHAVIRSMIVPEDQAKEEGVQSKELSPQIKKIFEPDQKLENGNFSIQISAKDCTGCMYCVTNCPTHALSEVSSAEFGTEEQEEFDRAKAMNIIDDLIITKETSQSVPMKTPLFEYSGACGGCAESTFLKLLSSQFGHRAVIAGATGCNTVYSSYYPINPWTTNKEGHGPAYARSLFENACQYGLGMAINLKTRRNDLKNTVESFLNTSNIDIDEDLLIELEKWIQDYDQGEESYKHYLKLKDKITNESKLMEENEDFIQIYKNKDLFVKPANFIIGGDGAMYDIGIAGLDHVMSTKENVTVFVLDNEVFANTGAQVSAASPLGYYGNLSISGNKKTKKNLPMQMLTKQNVFVASVSLANPQHLINTLEEAVEYDGPSIVFAFSPCKEHGVKGGLGRNRNQMEKFAVQSGMYPLFKYNPSLETNKFKLVTKSIKPELIENYMNMQSRFDSKLAKLYGEPKTDLEMEYKLEAERMDKEMKEELKESVVKRFEMLKTMGEFLNQ